MKWSWRIGRLAGIDVYVHFTFLILLGWVALVHVQHGEGLSGALGGILFILLLFGIVVLHELGHALTARHFGIATRDITLLPIGGVARLERMPEDPRQELLVALAGPAVNVALALGLFLLLAAFEIPIDLAALAEEHGDLGNRLLFINLWLAIFNLIPAFPMDGGRVLRAILAMRMEYVAATHVAAAVGQGLAVLFGLAGLIVGNPFLVFIALFVWLGAAEEASLAQMRSALAGIPVRRAMITDFRTLAPTDTLSRAIEHVLGGFQQDFPVADEGRVVGVLTRSDLLTALAQRGQEAIVGEVMQRDFATADPNDMLERALTRLVSCGCRSMPVVKDGQLVGLVTADNLSELLMIQEALRRAKTRA